METSSNKLSKEDFKKSIIAFFTKESGMTIAAAKAKIKSEIIIYQTYGYADNNRIKIGNVSLFYTPNKNYCGGIKNGYGAGWYISNQGMKGGTEIKLSEKL